MSRSAPALSIGGFAGETDVVTAATANIGSATTVKVRLTGAVTVTSFGTVPNTWKYVRCAEAFILTHNGTTLVLPGGANITTAADDTFIVLSDASGNWRVYNYCRADGTVVSGSSLLLPGITNDLTVGYTTSPYNHSSESPKDNIIPNPSLGFLQYLLNEGDGTITINEPTEDGYCVLMVENGSGSPSEPGAFVFNGFTTAIGTTTMDLVSGKKFLIFFYKGQGRSFYSIQAGETVAL